LSQLPILGKILETGRVLKARRFKRLSFVFWENLIAEYLRLEWDQNK